MGVFVAGGGALLGARAWQSLVRAGVAAAEQLRVEQQQECKEAWHMARTAAVELRGGGAASSVPGGPQPEPSSSAAVAQRARPPAAPSRSRSRRAPRRRRGRARPLVGAGDAGELRPWSEQAARASSAPSGLGSRQPRALPQACAAGRRAQALPRAAVLTGQTRGKRGKGADRWPPLPRVGHVSETTIQNSLMVNCQRF